MFKSLIEEILGDYSVKPAAGLKSLNQKDHGQIKYINYKNLGSYKKNWCWYNCKMHSNKYGGEIIFGWALHDKGDLQIAQHHAVWLSPDNEYIDITPNTPDKKTTFLIDNRTPFDYEGLRSPSSFFFFKEDNAGGWGSSLNDLNKYFVIHKIDPDRETLELLKNMI